MRLRPPATIAGKLALSFAILTGLAVTALGAVHIALSVARSTVQEATVDAARMHGAALEMTSAATASRVALADYLRTGEAHQRVDMRRAQLRFKAASSRYVASARTQHERRMGMDAVSVFGLLQDAEGALVRARDKRRAAYAAINQRYGSLEDALDETILDRRELAHSPQVRERVLGVQADLYDLLADVGAHMQHDDDAAGEKIEENLAEIEEGIDDLVAEPLARTVRAAVRRIRADAAASAPSAREVVWVEREIAQGTVLERGLTTRLAGLLEDGIEPLAGRRLRDARRRAEEATSRATALSLLFLPLFLLTAAAATVLVTRSVTRPVRRLIAETDAVEREGLGHRIGEVPGREFSLLAGHFDRMVERLEQTTVSRDRLEASQLELRRLTDELAHQADHDPLTGLGNRRSFDRCLESAVQRAAAGSLHGVLCYLDLDQFKLVNDNCGHGAGDELLRLVAATLEGQVRGGDVVARLGGDEFCVLLEGIATTAGAEAAGERLRAALADLRFTWGERSFTLTSSIGVVPLAAGTAPEVLLASADAACYAAKEKGRNRVQVFAAEDTELAQRRGEMQWAPEILRALDEGRMRLHVQPIVALHRDPTLKRHQEILIRMEDDRGQLVPPATFIPAAERYGLMGRIDRWVLETVIARLGAGVQRTPGGASAEMYAVNLSATSLSDPRLADDVETLLTAHDVPGDAICLEITETAAIANLDVARELIVRLGARGCHFALDDFGRGLSSFGYLRELPVSIIKIDGSFVRSMAEDPLCEAIVRSIHTIARTIGALTVAEFVEDDDILDRVRAVGIDYAQGFGVGRPTPLADLAPSGPARPPAAGPAGR